MQDKYGRTIEYLRLSVTQNCNLRCIYCMPSDEKDNSCECGNGSLSPADIEIITAAMAKLGIRKVRITGGEPLVRPDICEIISRIVSIKEIEDISLTTNGIRLSELASKLSKAGLKRVNISLDSLKPEVFSRITGGGDIQKVLDGIQKALDAGLYPVKVNTVLIKGINDSEIDDFIDLTAGKPIDVRFIELMPIGRYGESNTDKIIYNSDIIAAHPYLKYVGSEEEAQPATYYKLEGGKGRVGFISPMSHKFCNKCNRIRLTCDGKLKPCLGNNGEVDIMDTLRHHPDSLETLIRKVIYDKPEGHAFENGFKSDKRMKEIGG
jgi:molybdenum cofactor biosynthesis protein A, bacterial